MKIKIHPKAIVDPNAIVGENVEIEAFSYIGFSYDQIRRHLHPSIDNRMAENKVESFVPPTIGEGTFIGPYTMVGPGSKIGRNCLIEAQTFIGSSVIIGDNTFIRYACQIYNNVRIGNDCIISGFICNNTIVKNLVEFYGSCIHSNRERDRIFPEASPKILDEAFIGWNSIIVGGISIGRRSMIKVGSLITRDVKDGEVVEARGR